jgi:5'-nucleotidase/UDP-sugar diphosphatase
LTIKAKGKVIIEAMNLLAYDAMAIGDLDLRLGPEVLRERIAEAKFPILSANVQLAETGQLLALPCVIRQVGGHAVGIIDLRCDLAKAALGEAGRPYTILNANDVLTKYVAELSEKMNVIVVLPTLGPDEDQRLSSEVPGIDLIVSGRTEVQLEEGWFNEETGTVVVQAGHKGAWLERCRLHMDGSGAVTEHSCKLFFLTDEYPDDVEMQAFVDEYPAQQP